MTIRKWTQEQKQNHSDAMKLNWANRKANTKANTKASTKADVKANVKVTKATKANVKVTKATKAKPKVRANTKTVDGLLMSVFEQFDVLMGQALARRYGAKG